ncbi:TPA: hypothetical protein ACH3X1_007215 [Trebouxia sp. C0004]
MEKPNRCCSHRITLCPTLNQSTECASSAPQAQIGESTQCMHSTVREEALTAAGVQCADAILLQQIAKPLFRSMFVARTRQGLARNYFDHMWMRGGRGSWQQRIDQHF